MGHGATAEDGTSVDQEVHATAGREAGATVFNPYGYQRKVPSARNRALIL